MTEKKKNKKGVSILLILVIIICVGVLGFSAYKILTVQSNYRQAQNEYEELRGYTHTSAEAAYPEGESDATAQNSAQGNSTTEDSSASDSSASADKEDAKSTHGSKVSSKKHLQAPITIDHEELSAINSDYIGWLYIGALDISYPIMRGEDDEYYLHHTFDGSYLFAGSLFINSTSGRDFSDPHTLIYGHNMKDGSMFGTLRRLMDQGLYSEDPYFWVLTPEGDYRYKMFAMYTCQDMSETYTLFSGHGEIVKDYITAMKALSYVDLGEIEYDEDSKVVTLSTCVQAEGSDRFVVQGIRED